jgi:hypothetical protein
MARRVEECRRCVTGVGTSRRPHVTVLNASCSHRCCCFVRIRGCTRALCQNLVGRPGRGAVAWTTADALRKSWCRSPPEGGRRTRLSRGGGHMEPKLNSPRASAGMRRQCGDEMDHSQGIVTHARPCLAASSLVNGQRTRQASSNADLCGSHLGLCRLHPLLQQRIATFPLYLCFLFCLLRRRRLHCTASATITVILAPQQRHRTRTRGMC